MKLNRNRGLSLAVAGALLLMAGVASAGDIPLRNWSVPGGKTTMVDIGSSVPFQAMTPCRMADTRGAVPAPPINGGGPLVAGVPRNWTITGNCGIPINAVAVSANFTVVSTAGTGFLVAWPQGGVQPGVATLVYTGAGQLLSNAAVVPIGVAGQITVLAGVSNTHLIMDVNGYFTSLPNLNRFLAIVGSFDGLPAIGGANSSNTNNSTGVYGIAQGSGVVDGVRGELQLGTQAAGSAGVHGIGGARYGVLGVSTSSFGVFGVSGTNVAVLGQSSAGNAAAVLGINNTAVNGTQGVGGFAGGAAVVHGVQGQIGAAALAGASGVHGIGAVTTGGTFGVLGETDATASGSAGVRGRVGGAAFALTAWPPAGVAADNTDAFGVLARTTTGRAVQGCMVNATTGIPIGASCGVLGFSLTQGVFSFGDVAAAGAKTFIEPHPTDPSRQIVYISMEGPEAGTYFRGRGRLEGKTAVIAVPESFRLVTEEEGLTVQITPIGRATSVGVVSVVSMDLNQIVVESMRDVEFSYLVQGIRKNYLGHQPIQKNLVFVPAGPNARMEPFPPHIQNRLIDLGIYHADGTVNMETAERMGWAQKWRDEEKARQQISPKTSNPDIQSLIDRK